MSAIAAGPDGNLWFTRKAVGRIGRITTSGAVTEFPLPDPTSRPNAIAKGPDGNLWFTEEAAGRIGSISVTGTIREFPLPPGSEPNRLATGSDGNLWFTERGASKIGRIDTSGTITEFPLQDPASRPNEITPGPDGNLWFTDGAAGRVGRIATTGEITQFPVPVDVGTSAIAAGPASDIWFTAGSEIGSISPDGRTAPPSCLDDQCRIPPTSLGVGPEGDLWFSSGVRITEGGGAASILALQASGIVGKFIPPPLTVTIGLHVRPVAHRLTDLGLSCAGGAAGAECSGTLQLSVQIPRHPSRGSRGAEKLTVAHRRYELDTGERRRFPLRLTSKAVKLLSKSYLYAQATATAAGQVAATQPILLHLKPRHR